MPSRGPTAPSPTVPSSPQWPTRTAAQPTLATRASLASPPEPFAHQMASAAAPPTPTQPNVGPRCPTGARHAQTVSPKHCRPDRRAWGWQDAPRPKARALLPVKPAGGRASACCDNRRLSPCTTPLPRLSQKSASGRLGGEPTTRAQRRASVTKAPYRWAAQAPPTTSAMAIAARRHSVRRLKRSTPPSRGSRRGRGRPRARRCGRLPSVQLRVQIAVGAHPLLRGAGPTPRVARGQHSGADATRHRLPRCHFASQVRTSHVPRPLDEALLVVAEAQPHIAPLRQL